MLSVVLVFNLVLQQLFWYLLSHHVKNCSFFHLLEAVLEFDVLLQQL